LSTEKIQGSKSLNKQMSENTENTMKPEEVAEYFSVSRRTIYRLIEKRQIPFCKIRGRIRFRPEDIEAFMRSTRVEAILK
jgi:excisionase family DNA binding protein